MQKASSISGRIQPDSGTIVSEEEEKKSHVTEGELIASPYSIK
jgi:hypothetical protein